MKHISLYFIGVCALLLFASCGRNIKISRQSDKEVSIFPDYKNVTIPYNIAPLDFSVNGNAVCQLIISDDSRSFQVEEKDGYFEIPTDQWKEMLEKNKGKSIRLTVCEQQGSEWIACKPFTMDIAREPIDPYIAYRLIPPGYELWNEMGIYQRDLTTFKESCIYKNTLTDKNCVNCHSFCMQNPKDMMFHSRAKHAGTLVIKDGKIEKLNTKTDQTISPLVYPSWHPSGKYIAFSVNKTKQSFHNFNRNRIEVFDQASDVVVYEVNKHQITSCPFLKSEKAFETFPTFSPDGKSLYFCSAVAVDSMPQKFDKVKYNLCRIDFHPENMTFGNRVDTIFHAASIDKSVSFPRISPDGKYLVFTLHNYGNFSIWHKEADLYAVNLSNKKVFALTAANSKDTESYHSWSSNSRWLVFSSRRADGLYTRPFFTYIDKNGIAHKPFMLPQKNPRKYYQELMVSYNIPECIKGKVEVNKHEIAETLKTSEGMNISYK